MRCHFSDDDEMNPPAYNIWTSGNLQTPNILKSILNLNVSDANSFADNLSSLCTLESASSSQKRKILDCEKEDFEERFHKIQRKKQLQKVAAKANLVIDDDNEESDEEEKIYEQMDWFERQNGMCFELCDSSSDDDEHPLLDDDAAASVLFKPRSKLKDERRRLLRISMAKIRCVEDPEAYLRRSVLINNTVRRLQNDIPINCRWHFLETTFLDGNVYTSESLEEWGDQVLCKQNQSNTVSTDYEYSSVRNNDGLEINYIQCYGGLHNTASFETICNDSNKTFNTYNHEALQITDPFYSKDCECEQKLNEDSLPPIIIKSTSCLNMFPSQSCGLQYRNLTHSDDSDEGFRESSGSSLIDSVVYSSLMASLETT